MKNLCQTCRKTAEEIPVTYQNQNFYFCNRKCQDSFFGMDKEVSVKEFNEPKKLFKIESHIKRKKSMLKNSCLSGNYNNALSTSSNLKEMLLKTSDKTNSEPVNNLLKEEYSKTLDFHQDLRKKKPEIDVVEHELRRHVWELKERLRLEILSAESKSHEKRAEILNPVYQKYFQGDKVSENE